MYSTLTALSDFPHAFNKELTDKIGMEQGLGNPCCFYDPKTDCKLVYHRDDIAIEGDREGVEELEAKIGKTFTLVRKALLGLEPGDDKHAMLLNRLIYIDEDGLHLEADPRHAQLIIASPGLHQTKGATTPQREISAEEFAGASRLDEQSASQCRSIVARLRYLSEDRPDTAFVANACCRGMAKPTTADAKMLKKIGRYLTAHPRLTIDYPPQISSDKITVQTSDHAGCVQTHASTSGWHIHRNGHNIGGGTSTQSTASWSSDENEHYACLKDACEGLGVLAVSEELGEPTTLLLETNFSASCSKSRRRGHGKLKHMEAKWLWLQWAFHQKRLNIKKIPRSEHRSDIFTKACDKNDLENHLAQMSAQRMQITD